MLRIRQIKVEVEKDNKDYLVKAISQKLRISKNDIIDFVIHKQSIDARNKDRIYYVYEVNFLFVYKNKFCLISLW